MNTLLFIFVTVIIVLLITLAAQKVLSKNITKKVVVKDEKFSESLNDLDKIVGTISVVKGENSQETEADSSLSASSDENTLKEVEEPKEIEVKEVEEPKEIDSDEANHKQSSPRAEDFKRDVIYTELFKRKRFK